MPSRFSHVDHAHMQRALTLARRGMGLVEPNPMVGCVLVRRQRVVGEGYHRRYGGPHAEIEALAKAGRLARGATAYVTLEPCSHFGKTPPCTQALIEAGIAQVIAAHGDPFSQVAGKGFRALRQAGIAVQSGLLADEAIELNAPFLTRVVRKRPFIIAKWAQSLDGKIATRSGDSKWITGPKARQDVHRLRARVDAIAVGIKTVLADDPQLTARDTRIKRIAARVVFDSHLRIPLDAKLVSSALAVPTIVLTTTHAVKGKSAKRVQLEERGVTVIACRSADRRVSVRDALRKLAALNVTNVLVEGGGALIGSLMDACLVDEVYAFTAPLILGGCQAPSGCGGRGVSAVRRAVVARKVTRKVFGNDVLTILQLIKPPECCRQITV